MKANELRIGNIIKQIDNGIGFRVSEKNIGAIIINLDKFKPIPLTEEWLLKFGFKEKIYKGHFEIERARFVISYDFENGENVSDIYGCSLCYGEYSNGAPIDIKYVHQLQNLYFALTGEELPHGL